VETGPLRSRNAPNEYLKLNCYNAPLCQRKLSVATVDFPFSKRPMDVLYS